MCTQWSFLLLWRDFCFSAIGRYPYLWYHIATDGAGYFYERESSVDLFDKYPNVIIKGLTYSPKEVSSVLKRVINIRWKFLMHSKKRYGGHLIINLINICLYFHVSIEDLSEIKHMVEEKKPGSRWIILYIYDHFIYLVNYDTLS